MKNFLHTAVLAAAAAFVLAPAMAKADVLDDPLLGWCAAGCVDNGTNTPITSLNQTFGFFSSPSNTGTLQLKFLIPNNDPQPVGGAITVTGTSGGTTNFRGDWTSGNLDTFLGFSGSPNNPIGAFLPATQALDPGATGFDVYTVLVGTYTLPTPGAGTPPDRFQINFNAPQGSYALANLILANGDVVATANSGALFVTTHPVPGPIVGAGLPGLIAACGGLLALARRRRQLVV
jgi:hypothetical protein